MFVLILREKERERCERGNITVPGLPHTSQPNQNQTHNLEIEPTNFFSIWEDAPTNWGTRPGLAVSLFILCYFFLCKREMHSIKKFKRLPSQINQCTAGLWVLSIWAAFWDLTVWEVSLHLCLLGGWFVLGRVPHPPPPPPGQVC